MYKIFMMLTFLYNKFFELIWGKYKTPKLYKASYSKDVFENYVSKNNSKKVKKIYDAGSFRADGKYLANIKQILASEKYDRIYSQSKDDLYVVDKSGEFEMPYGDKVSVYLIQWDRDNYQLIVEFWKAPELPNLTPYKKSVLFNKTIGNPRLLVWNAEQIYPYE